MTNNATSNQTIKIKVMDITAIKIFKVDIHQQAVEPIEQSVYGIDFDNYLKGLVNLITTGSSGRNFRFDSDTTEIRGQISKIFDGHEFSSIATTTVNRLLKKEQEAQAKMAKLGVEIQKGIVVQALVTENDISKFVICKADHSDFLDEINFTISRRLPLKKRVFKAFVCSLNSDNTVTNVLVYDTNPNLSQYWWKEFLELTKVYSDEDNTENAFGAIDKGIFTKIKKKYPQDYMHLRNSTVRYFRANDNFDMQNYLDTAIGNYTPFDNKLDVEEIKSQIKELPTKPRAPFDVQFTIVKSKIRAKFLNTIPLTSQIDLHLKEDIPNIETIITAEKDADGTRYVKIKSDQGYQYFSNGQNGNS
ncbi:MAG: nucleoid-associated protein [Bacteroidetes bacterium]|nr:nucleoid-associated protein [Bacteroidota bacterium]